MKAVVSSANFIENHISDHLFLTEIRVKFKNHRYIHDQQVKIYKNLYFVFDLTVLEFFKVTSTAVLTRR